MQKQASRKMRDSVGEDLIGEAYDELENLAGELNDEGEDDDIFNNWIIAHD